MLCHDESFKINGADSFVFIRSKNSIKTFCFPLFERFPILDKKIFKYYWLKIFQKNIFFVCEIILEKNKCWRENWKIPWAQRDNQLENEIFPILIEWRPSPSVISWKRQSEFCFLENEYARIYNFFCKSEF